MSVMFLKDSIYQNRYPQARSFGYSPLTGNDIDEENNTYPNPIIPLPNTDLSQGAVSENRGSMNTNNGVPPKQPFQTIGYRNTYQTSMYPYDVEEERRRRMLAMGYIQ